jgi:hypothetical protein
VGAWVGGWVCGCVGVCGCVDGEVGGRVGGDVRDSENKVAIKQGKCQCAGATYRGYNT